MISRRESITTQTPSPLRGEPFNKLRAVNLPNGVGVRVNDRKAV